MQTVFLGEFGMDHPTDHVAAKPYDHAVYVSKRPLGFEHLHESLLQFRQTLFADVQVVFVLEINRLGPDSLFGVDVGQQHDHGGAVLPPLDAFAQGPGRRLDSAKLHQGVGSLSLAVDLGEGGFVPAPVRRDLGPQPGQFGVGCKPGLVGDSLGDAVS